MTKSVALHRYHTLEYQLNNNYFLRQQYIEFMQDYLTMGYMGLIILEDKDNAFHITARSNPTVVPQNYVLYLMLQLVQVPVSL